MERKWWTLVVVTAATFMLILDITVVNVALPSIREDLGASFSDLQWVVDAYALTLAAFVLTSGSLADRLGRRRVFAIGVVIFTVASAICALSTTPLMLNLLRAVQGIGAAIMFAVSLALLGQEFHGRERARATAIYGASIGVGVAAGPLLGGALTDGLSWHWIFWINVPIGLAMTVVTISRVAESRDPGARGADWVGLLTFSLANALLVYALIRGTPEGWGSGPILGALIIAGGLFVAFVVAELRVDDPMLPLAFFRSPSFTGAQVGAFAISASMFALFLYLTLYVQNLLGHTAFEAGLIYLPSTIVTFVFSGLTATLMTRLPMRVILAVALVILAVGLVLLAGREEGDTWLELLPGFITTGVGVGMANPVIANLALSTVPDENAGVAAGINDTFRQVGIATGVAALGALLLARAMSEIQSLLPATPDDVARGMAEGVSSGAMPSDVPANVLRAAREGYLAGLNDVLLIGAGIALLGGLLCFWLVREGGLRPMDSLLLQLAEEMGRTGTVSDALWSRLESSWEPRRLEILLAEAGMRQDEILSRLPRRPDELKYGARTRR